MSRRYNKRRRDERRAREPRQDLHPPYVPVDHERARAKVMHLVSTWTYRGSKTPVFQGLDLVFGPTVQLDPTSATPIPEQIQQKTLVALVAQTRDQKPS